MLRLVTLRTDIFGDTGDLETSGLISILDCQVRAFLILIVVKSDALDC